MEFATLEWVAWHNNSRLHSWYGDVPPVEYEQLPYRANTDASTGVSAHPFFR